ncbi:MAG: transcriptional regulator [Actinobacteria bacterium]|nr:transcriptional regulator [Actinomycetota bacterium]
MPYPSDPRLVVLHTLAVKGVSSVEALLTATALSATDVVALLDELREAGSVEHREGMPAGWSLTRVGRKERDVLLAEELDVAGARTAVEAAYHRFQPINAELLTTCTAWQLRDSGGAALANDHADADYDGAVVRRLVELDARARPVLADLAAVLARLGAYRPRLDHALRRVVAGEGDWFTRPLIDSYHTVWFELHQDLLDTLGIERGSQEQR